MNRRFISLSLTLGVLALLALFSTIRLAGRGAWLPPLPTSIGDWKMTELNVTEKERNMLGNPQISGFELENPLQERIFGRVVAPSSFDALGPPELFQYYSVTAQKMLPLDGGASVLGQVWRMRSSDLRILMFTWLQREDGSTTLLGTSTGSARSLPNRLNMGIDSVLSGNRLVLVRLYTIIHPADPEGAQARRNLLSAARSLHAALPGGDRPAAAHGRQSAITEDGADLAYLTSKPAPDDRGDVAPLLPLKPGGAWDFEVAGKDPIPERVVVAGPIVVGGVTGTRVDIFRFGKLWRREVYQQDASALRLLAFGDASSTLIEVRPPMALVKYPLKEGSDVHWKGVLALKGRNMQTLGYSRVSAHENIVSGAGRFAAWRLDSVLTIPGDKPTHFPAIRWMAPGIGFVRRGYADEGKPAVAELKRFTVK